MDRDICLQALLVSLVPGFILQDEELRVMRGIFAWVRCILVGWLFGRVAGWLAGWLVGWLVGWSVGGWLAGWLAG